MPPRNLQRLSRVYGPATWDVYERLDVSLNPAGPDSLFDTAATYLRAGRVVLDAGCRDGAHLIELVRRFNVRGVGVEPVALHVERAKEAVQAAGLADRITLHHGVMNELRYPDCYFDFVWCRDVLEQVDDLDGALVEVVRVMKPAARLLVYTVVATESLTADDAEVIRRHLGNVEGNLDRAVLEGAFARSGLAVESVEVVGTEWREYAEERTHPVSRALLRLARLRRQRDDVVHEHGRDIYEHIEANLHWELFQFLGKLEPLVYVLAPGGRPLGAVVPWAGEVVGVPDEHGHEMPAEAAQSILEALRSADVAVVVGGGWAVDALLGEQTRPHADLDVWVRVEQFERLVRAVVGIGLDRLHPWGDDRPWNFVFHDGGTLRLDLHLYEAPDEESLRYGSATTGETFSAAALSGNGVINGTPVACEAPEWVLRWHIGYPLRPVDRHDIVRLCERFGFDLPQEYL